MSALSIQSLDVVSGLSRNWGWIFLRGVLAILFGILAWRHPVLAGLTLTFLWGWYALIEGVVSLVAAFQIRQSGKPMWPMVLMAVLGITAGVMTFFNPGMTMIALLMLIASWSVVIGGLKIVTAVRMRNEIEGEWLLGIAGLISVVFGIAMFVHPGAGALAVVWLISIYAIMFGVLLVIFSLKARSMGKNAKG